MTLTVTVEPSFLALTTTPSMAPSAAEVTCPARAGALFCAAADCGAAAKRMTAELRAKIDKRRRVRIGSSLWVAMGGAGPWFNDTRLESPHDTMCVGLDPLLPGGLDHVCFE